LEWNFWSNLPSMSTARRSLMDAGTQSAALAFGGYTGSSPSNYLTATEEWTGEVATAGSKTLTTS
jgi:hypothetical protein